MPSAVIPCSLSPSWASLSTTQITRAPYWTAVLISLFISIAPSPTTVRTRREDASAAPTHPVVKWPMEPQAALVRYRSGVSNRSPALHHVNDVPASLMTRVSVSSTMRAWIRDIR